MPVIRFLLIQALVVLVAFASGGCASQKGSPLIDSASYDNALPKLESSGEHGTIVVRRDGGSFASGLRARLFLDGVSIFNLRPSQYVELRVRPGRHELMIKSNGALLLPVASRAVVDIENGSRKLFRVALLPGSGMRLEADTDHQKTSTP